MGWSQRRWLYHFASFSNNDRLSYIPRILLETSTIVCPVHLEHLSNHQIYSSGEFLTGLQPLVNGIFREQLSRHNVLEAAHQVKSFPIIPLNSSNRFQLPRIMSHQFLTGRTSILYSCTLLNIESLMLCNMKFLAFPLNASSTRI